MVIGTGAANPVAGPISRPAGGDRPARAEPLAKDIRPYGHRSDDPPDAVGPRAPDDRPGRESRPDWNGRSDRGNRTAQNCRPDDADRPDGTDRPDSANRPGTDG